VLPGKAWLISSEVIVMGEGGERRVKKRSKKRRGRGGERKEKK